MDATSMKRVMYPITRGETIGDIYYATITDNSVDRQNEIVDPDGVDIKNFLLNGPVLYGHAYQGIESIPVGKMVSLSLVHENERKKWDAGFVFQGDDVTPLISAVHKSWERGFLNAVSIGFLAKEYDGNTITKSELLEFSIVPVPANPMALRLNGFTDPEIKALGVEVTPETLIADLEAMVTTKEGRVLSQKNRDLVKSCIDSLQALYEASDTSAAGAAQPEPDDWLTALHKALIT
jgi:hypothetical protein